MLDNVINRIGDKGNAARGFNAFELCQLQFAGLATRALDLNGDKATADNTKYIWGAALVAGHDFADPTGRQRPQVVGDFFLNG